MDPSARWVLADSATVGHGGDADRVLARDDTKYSCKEVWPKDVWPTDIGILCTYDSYDPRNGPTNGDLGVHVLAFPVRRPAYFFLAGAAGFLAAEVSALPILGFLSCSFSLVNSCTLACA